MDPTRAECLRKENRKARAAALAKLKEREVAAAARSLRTARPLSQTEPALAPLSRPQTAASGRTVGPAAGAAAPSRPASASAASRPLASASIPSGADEPAAGARAWDLPAELLSLVLAQLRVEERARLARVSRAWRAASLAPPFSTIASFRVWIPDEGRSRKPQEPKAPPAAVLLPDAAVSAIGSPVCAGLRDLSVELLFENDRGQQRAARRVAALFESVPAGVERLSLVVSEAFVLVDPTLDLALRLPLLKELYIEHPRSKARYKAVPLHRGPLPSLESVGALAVGPPGGDWATVEQVLERAPRLRTVQSLCVWGAGALAALDSAGYACRRLEVRNEHTLDPEAVPAARALLGRAPPGPAPTTLSCEGADLNGPWPPDALESVERLEVSCCRFDEAWWRWLVHSAAWPVLREISLFLPSPECFMMAAPFIAELADSVPEGARIRLEAYVGLRMWGLGGGRAAGSPQMAQLLEHLLASPRALRATEIVMPDSGGFGEPARTVFFRYSTARGRLLRPSASKGGRPTPYT